MPAGKKVHILVFKEKIARVIFSTLDFLSGGNYN